ncbi:DNA-directed DNA polymerase delta [Ophidiomyces ophidiicola]|nr:DNA-directed DNA polymerase delta [Ophidiomyces ophidiicola]KAI2396190.1 DNA-directed DNA polymerase delta [Ophidiomyces ophidiicola]
MAESLLTPQKRVLGDSTKTRGNLRPISPNATKKRKLDSQPDVLTKPHLQPDFRKRITPASSQSQQKSQFVEEVLEKLTQDISDLKESNAEKDQQWRRPSLGGFDPAKDSLCFQQIEAEEGILDRSGTAVKLFGVTEAGHSVLLHVTDFKHYLYVAAPVSFEQSDCAAFQSYLESQLAMHQPAIHSVRMVLKENLFGFQGNQRNPYLQITVTDPKHIHRLRSIIENGNANFRGLWKVAGTDGILTFDNIQYILRFMIDTGISGMSWVEVPPSKYEMLPPNRRQSNCQIEAAVHYRDLIAHPHDGEWAKMAPLRVLSFDIECAGRKGIFPEPQVDPVIQIANIVTRYGDSKPFVRNVFVLDTCSSIVNTQVLEFNDEAKMLNAWRDFLEEVDPDVIIGYNIANFDFPYLLERAQHLKCNKFPFWTRLKNTISQSKDTNFSSKQMGNRDTKATNTNGRIQLDLLQLIQRDHQLRSYTLNSVCSHFLGEQKEDVHHTMITELFNGTPDSRRRLAVYCLKDAYLPQRLMDKLMCLVNYTEMARVTGVPFNYLLSRGQQVKFISQLFRKALEQKLVIPNIRNEIGEEQYEGATVIEPVKGYYDVPIATLDFASLYPSIIQAHNLCYTTLLNKTSVEKLKLEKGEDYIVTPNGDMFCTAKVRKGLLSQILEELLSARKRAKKDLATETDPFKKAVLNGRQLALKISANSVYGITGASNGKLPCLAIASSTTSYGRQMIEKTKDEVEARYTIANGYAHDAKVIYGDTDSVMVKFGVQDLPEAMKLGQEAADFVSSKFLKPIKLEFEKVYFPYLLINKKRYAGLYWTNTEKHDKMDSKGIETVRRDNCRLVQTVIETVLKKILIDRDVGGAQRYVMDTISDLLQNKVDMSKLVITKALSKSGYKAKQAHVELAERMRKRDAGSAPTLGDRVAYVIIKGAGGSKNYEKSEDPIYVLENNIPIDTRYYLDNQLAKPLARIFDPILGEKKASQLLAGEHTRSISVAAPTLGGLMKFAKKTQTCMGCKKPLVGKDEKPGAVCDNCRPRLGELYNKTLNRVSDLELPGIATNTSDSDLNMSGARKLPSTEVSGREARTNSKNCKCDSQQTSACQTKSPVGLPINPDRKRRRDEAAKESCTQHGQSANIRKKRKIGLLIHNHSISMADPNSHPNYTPTVNHEDISDEVEARLKLKEIARRNINGQREKKRKRDGSQSPSECTTIDSSTILRRKRLRTKNGNG